MIFPNLSLKRFIFGERCLNFPLVPKIHFPVWNMSIIKAATTVEFLGKSLQNTAEYTNAHRRGIQEPTVTEGVLFYE